MSIMDSLKRAYSAQSISRDNYSLETYLQAEGVKGVAKMVIKGIESKFVPSQIKPNGNQGFRTRFILDTGETVGTFSNGAHMFFQFYAQILGYTGNENFLSINITEEGNNNKEGFIELALSLIQLDGNKKTYDFQLIGGNAGGFRDYRPDFSLLALGSADESETAATTEDAAEETADTEAKTAKDKKAKTDPQ